MRKMNSLVYYKGLFKNIFTLKLNLLETYAS